MWRSFAGTLLTIGSKARILLRFQFSPIGSLVPREAFLFGANDAWPVWLTTLRLRESRSFLRRSLIALRRCFRHSPAALQRRELNDTPRTSWHELARVGMSWHELA